MIDRTTTPKKVANKQLRRLIDDPDTQVVVEIIPTTTMFYGYTYQLAREAGMNCIELTMCPPCKSYPLARHIDNNVDLLREIMQSRMIRSIDPLPVYTCIGFDPDTRARLIELTHSIDPVPSVLDKSVDHITIAHRNNLTQTNCPIWYASIDRASRSTMITFQIVGFGWSDDGHARFDVVLPFPTITGSPHITVSFPKKSNAFRVASYKMDHLHTFDPPLEYEGTFEARTA